MPIVQKPKVKAKISKNIKILGPKKGIKQNAGGLNDDQAKSDSEMKHENPDDDLINKEDFDASSEEEEEEETEIEKEEDDGLGDDKDYGDDEQKYNEGEDFEHDGESCLYKIIKKSSVVDSDDEGEEFDDIMDDDVDDEPTNTIRAIIVRPEERETKPILTKYERVRILGHRTKQLSNNAKPLVSNVDGRTSREIAQLELENGCMPFIIDRQLPDGRHERWRVSELKIIN